MRRSARIGKIVTSDMATFSGLPIRREDESHGFFGLAPPMTDLRHA